MLLETWMAFAATVAAMMLLPGPTMLLVISYALGGGRRSGWATVPGVALGDLVGMTASLAGVGAVLATSAMLFTVMKFAGAAYLVWLGVKMWRASPNLAELREGTRETKPRAMFLHAFAVTALNPKSIVFFIAFVPHFVDPTRPLLPQFAILEATFIVLAAVTMIIWAVVAGELRSRLTRPPVLRMMNRLGGSFLIGAGLMTATLRRSS